MYSDDPRYKEILDVIKEMCDNDMERLMIDAHEEEKEKKKHE